MISGHPYEPNGLGARDENGNVPCAQCRLPRDAHTNQGVTSTPRIPASGGSDRDGIA